MNDVGMNAPWLALFGAVVKHWSAQQAICIMEGTTTANARWRARYQARRHAQRAIGTWDFIRAEAAKRGEFTAADLVPTLTPGRAVNNCYAMEVHGALRVVRYGPPRVYALP